jgi:hypothetical protein
MSTEEPVSASDVREAHDGEPVTLPVKKPYAPPQVRSLGTVAELTFGGGNTTSDGLGIKQV